MGLKFIKENNGGDLRVTMVQGSSQEGSKMVKVTVQVRAVVWKHYTRRTMVAISAQRLELGEDHVTLVVWAWAQETGDCLVVVMPQSWPSVEKVLTPGQGPGEDRRTWEGREVERTTDGEDGGKSVVGPD